MMIPRNNTIIANYRASKVRRYHARPETPVQTTGDHSHGMLILLYRLHPNPSPALVKAITFHDADELFGGDMPWPFKQSFPELAKQHAIASETLAKTKGIITPPELDQMDAYWLAFLDRVETILWLAVHCPLELTYMDWIVMAQDLHSAKRKLEIEDPEIAEVLSLPNLIKAQWMAAA